MIRDAVTKAEIAQDWEAVRKLCHPERAYFLPGYGIVTEQPDNDFYNLPFVLAYAVLDRALNELRDQGEFNCNTWKLGAKMAASRNVLSWQDYDLVDDGRNVRNDVAHKAQLASKANCLRFIGAVEAELKAWAIL